MQNKKADKKIFSFYSCSSPHDFIASVEDKAVRSNLKIEQTEMNFHLQIDSNHGGKIVYKADISAGGNGGSVISGKIVTIPWNDNSKDKKNIFQKILSILGYIIVLPLVLIFLFCYGIYSLCIWLFRRKIGKSTHE